MKNDVVNFSLEKLESAFQELTQPIEIKSFREKCNEISRSLLKRELTDEEYRKIIEMQYNELKSNDYWWK